MNRGHALGPVCVTTVYQGAGTTLVDSGWTRVEKWGDDTHGSLVIRPPWSPRALVLVLRGARVPRERWLHPIRWRRRPRRSTVVEGGCSQVAP